MITYRNNSETAVIVVHEIYGINQHITSVCEKLSAEGNDVFCPNMLNVNKSFRYDQEALAYSNFMEHVGFHKASNQIKELLYEIRSRYDFVYLIGFSIGATIAWLCSREENICDAVICFYGSRIRDFIDFEPHCPVYLFFPCQEKSFIVPDLVNSLREKHLVRAKIFPGKHGFADPYSIEYCEQSATAAYQDMVTFIDQLIRGNAPST